VLDGTLACAIESKPIDGAEVIPERRFSAVIGNGFT